MTPKVTDKADRARIPNIYLRAGELYISGDPARVSTVLGSCVSITMFGATMGAICHVLLPEYMNEGWSEKSRFRFADYSIRWMADKFGKAGVSRSAIEVKIFGGANVFALEQKRNSLISVGQKNIETALKVIEAEGLKLCARDVGGEWGRKLFFYTHTGEVELKRFKNSIPSYEGRR